MVVIVGIISAFAIPAYDKVMDKSTERETILNLRVIAAANKIYFAKKQVYWPMDWAVWHGVSEMNSALAINILEMPGVSYACSTSKDFLTSVCRGLHTDGWTVVTQSNANNGYPFCAFGPCPSCKKNAEGGC